MDAAAAEQHLADPAVGKKYSAFMLTIWRGADYRNELVDRLNELIEPSSGAKAKLHAAAYQLERAPNTGRLHWQVYISCKSARRPSEIRKWLEIPDGADAWVKCVFLKKQDENWAVVHDRCAAYCTKDDSREEAGDIIGACACDELDNGA